MGQAALQHGNGLVHAFATLQYFRVVIVAVGVRGVLCQKFFKPLQRQRQFIGAGVFLRNAVNTKVIRRVRGVQLLQLFKS